MVNSRSYLNELPFQADASIVAIVCVGERLEMRGNATLKAGICGGRW